MAAIAQSIYNESFVLLCVFQTNEERLNEATTTTNFCSNRFERFEMDLCLCLTQHIKVAYELEDVYTTIQTHSDNGNSGTHSFIE